MARNEFGVKLDSNGYAPSIVQPRKQDECYLCHCGGDLARHEIFFGSGRREKSKRHGLWVYLCPACHQGDYGVHGQHGHDNDMWLKHCGQLAAEVKYGWNTMEFISEYGKSYEEV